MAFTPASPRGRSLGAVEEVVLAEIERLRTGGITPEELKKVHAQLRARFVYDGDSVTDIAHQFGYFETIASWRRYHSLRRPARTRSPSNRCRRPP